MKITVVTSSRADWASTGMVVKALRAEPTFDVSVLAIAASGPALKALGWAMQEDGIRDDFVIHSCDLTKDDGVNLAAAYGDAARFAGEALWRLNPDWVVLPGDRWEMLSCASAAVLAGIPIAHLAGGDETQGSMDDKFRNAITAMATLHFATNYRAFYRLLSGLGVNGLNVHPVGSPAIDRIKATKLLKWNETVQGLPDKRPRIVVNWQPETMSPHPNAGLHAILDALPKDATVVFCTVNDDASSEEARQIIASKTGQIPRSFTPRVYLSLLANCDLLIGNSSSGIYEAPSFGVPVINVGDRQTGRSQWTSNRNWSSIKNCPADVVEIRAWVDRMLAVGKFEGADEVVYGDGHACEKIVEVFRQIATGGEHGQSAAAAAVG